MKNLLVNITAADKSWRGEDKKIITTTRKILQKIAPQTDLSLLPPNISIEISVLLTNDEEIKQLNKNYRHKNKPTNVLSFPAFDTKKIKAFRPENLPIIDNFLPLGDIALAFETIKNEAAEQNKSFNHHFTHLLTHSLLHLLGYDHETNKDADLMENLEIKILKTLAITNPYSVRF